MTRTLANVADRLARRSSTRRSFLGKAAVAGSALATVPAEWVLKPRSAYAAICCSRAGMNCSCGSLCCDGYTEFCCATYGKNDCPPGTVVAGWWRADGSGYCGAGQPRYYLDCNASCGSCGCSSSGVCDGACGGCAGESKCGNDRCDHRKTCTTRFRYGNCNNDVPCVGPIACRVVTCTPPWTISKFDCDAGPARVDNNTRFHNRPCLQQSNPTDPRPPRGFDGTLVVGDWNGDGRSQLGYVTPDMRWHLRRGPGPGAIDTEFTFGRRGDVPVVGDWNGGGKDLPGVVRGGRQWFLRTRYSGGAADISFSYGIAGDVPIVGDWTGRGRDLPGVVRGGRRWLLRDSLGGGSATFDFTYGTPGDRAIAGKWDGGRRDLPGIVRQGRKYYLRNALESGPASISFSFGAVGDELVIGDWTGRGVDTPAAVRRREHHWYLADRNESGPAQRVWFFPEAGA